jgi:hypothetical protein
MARMNGALKAALLLSLAAAPAALAQAPAPAGRAAALKALTDCRAVTEGAARLACFDAAAARLDQAERTGDVVVLDREQVRTAKREAFGLKLPSFDLFDRDERQRTVEVDRVESTVASAGRGATGWVVTLENGQVWRQTDNKSLYRVRRGDKVEIRRGTLGSFFLRVGDQPGVRAVRAG